MPDMSRIWGKQADFAHSTAARHSEFMCAYSGGRHFRSGAWQVLWSSSLTVPANGARSTAVEFDVLGCGRASVHSSVENRGVHRWKAMDCFTRRVRARRSLALNPTLKAERSYSKQLTAAHAHVPPTAWARSLLCKVA